MFRRRRPLMRAAMVGGAGYYAGKKIQEGREADAERDARLDEVEMQQAAPPSAGGMSNDVIDQLGKLGQLHEQGVLTDEEFAIQKQKLLQST
jgi:Short C-terminal domain